MTARVLWYPGDDVVIWGVNVLLQVTLVAATALLIARFWKRNAAARHWVLCSTLFLVLLSPVAAALMQSSGLGAFSVSLLDDALDAKADEPVPRQGVAPKVDASGRASAAPPIGQSLPLIGSAGDLRFEPGMGVPHRPLEARIAEGTETEARPERPGDSAPVGQIGQPEPTEPSPAFSLGVALRVAVPPVLLLWLVGAAVCAVRLFRGWWRLARILRAAEPLAVESFDAIVADACDALGAARPQLVTSPDLTGPIAAGIWRPLVVLPARLADEISSHQLRDVLIHEVAHVRRRDQVVALLQNVAAALFWLHPLVHLLNRQLARAREEVCDNHVLAATDAPSYGRTLLRLAELIQRNDPLPASVGLFASRWKLETRVAGLLDERRNLVTRLTRCGMGLVLLISAMLAGLGSAVTVAPAAGVDSRDQERRGASDTSARDDATGRKSAEEATDGIASRDWVTVRGRVLDPQGRPLSNAKLAVVLFSHVPNCDQRPRPPAEVWDEAESDADGSFAMSYRKPPADFYEKRAFALVVLASHDGFGVSWEYLKFSDGDRTAAIQLKPEQVRRGRLVNLEGQPVPGAKIHVFAVGVPAPQWQRFDRWPWHHGLPLDERVSTTVPVNADGSADWEEEVEFHEPPFAVAPWPRSTTTDADGRFAIHGTGRDQRVQFLAYAVEKGGSTVLGFDRTSEAEPGEQVFVANEQRLIEGTVTDADTGRPVAGAKVRIDATGASLFTAQWPLIADWKGRQNHLGRMYALPGGPSEFSVPPVFTETGADGRFRVSAIPNPYGQQQFRVTVSSPDDRPYVACQETIDWPQREAFQQEVAIKLRPGVRVRGQVVHEATGQPVARARVDFWSKELQYPFEHRASPTELTPDGDVHPAWRKADFDGRFEVIVPHGRSYLFVNEGTDDNEVDRIDAMEVGMQDGEQPLTPRFTMVVEPLGRSTQPHRYYPDRLVKLDFGREQRSAGIRVTLRQAPVLKIRVVLPGGNPATDVAFYGGQEPFKEQTDGKLAPIQQTGDAEFEIPHRVDGPISVAFYSPQHSAGAVAEFTRDQADEPVTIQLQPVGRATVRFVDADGRPLAHYRPLLWMSLPRQPYSGARDLERLARQDADGVWPLQRAFDVIWTAMLDKERYGDLTADADGKATLPALIPGATYRISQFNGEAEDFSVGPGATVELGDVVIFGPERTKDLPVTKAAPAEPADVEAADTSAGGHPAATEAAAADKTHQALAGAG